MVLSIDRWVGKVAVVTGVSAGIGAAVAEQLVEKGVNVVGLARRKVKLEVFAKKLAARKGAFYPVVADVSKEEDIISAFKWIKENVGPVHILINNAGMASMETFINGKSDSWRKIFQLNVIGLCIATREAIRDMKENNVDGHIIHINSLWGHQVYIDPPLSVLSASKFAVTALAETLRLELNAQKSKIKITSISPGAVNTEALPIEFKQSEHFKHMVKEKAILEPEDVADNVLYVLSTPPHVQIQELAVRTVVEVIS